MERNREFRWCAGNVPRVRRQRRLHRPASWCTTSPATAKLPRNSPSLPHSRLGWRLPPPVCTLPTPRSPDSIQVYDLVRQPSNLRGIYRRCRDSRAGLAVTASRVYVANDSSAGQHSSLRPVRQPSNLRRIYRRYHVCRSGLAVTASRVYVTSRRLRRKASWYTTCPATVKPPKNLPSLPRRRSGLAVTASRVYVANSTGTR